jgi:hypothetical protein
MSGVGEIVEFLLARIAEDEVSWRLNLTVIADEDYERDVRRVLARCEAARRIVALHSGDEHECDEQEHWAPLTFDALGCDTLRALASVDADHEDYRPEWRVEEAGS